MAFIGDGTFMDDLLCKARKVVHVPACLFVHNWEPADRTNGVRA